MPILFDCFPFDGDVVVCKTFGIEYCIEGEEDSDQSGLEVVLAAGQPGATVRAGCHGIDFPFPFTGFARGRRKGLEKNIGTVKKSSLPRMAIMVADNDDDDDDGDRVQCR